MKIGVVRHHKVELGPHQGWLTGEQFKEWVVQYDAAGILHTDVQEDDHVWDYCLCSDLPRAADTAHRIYRGDIRHTDLLREIQMAAPGIPGIRLPLFIWLALGRIAWVAGHSSQPESRRDTVQRAKAVMDLLEAKPQQENVLVVTHGAFMKVILKELRHRKYKGKGMIHPRNGQLYVYTK